MQKKNQTSDIFASQQSEKILTGMITSIGPVEIHEKQTNCAMLNYEGYKVILSADLLGVRDELAVLRSFIGATISFVIIGISEEQKVAIGSRLQAMENIRNKNKNRNLKGQTITAKITGIGQQYLYAEAYGVETKIYKNEVDYGYIENLRDYVEIGDEVNCKVLSSDIENNKLELSMKALKEDPYDNLDKLFALRTEHLATITNIQSYGIFLIFDQNPQISVLCPIPNWNNFSPAIRDKYVVKIKRIKDNKINGTLIRFVKSADA